MTKRRADDLLKKDELVSFISKINKRIDRRLLQALSLKELVILKIYIEADKTEQLNRIRQKV